MIPFRNYQSMLGQDKNNIHTVPWWNKLTVLLAILIPTVVSIAIGVLDRRDYHNSGLLYRQTLQNRTTIQAFVHIVSSILAFLWTFSITKSIFYLTTTSFVRKDVAVSRLRLWSAVTIPQVGWDMSFGPAFVALVFLMLTSLPGVLWAGALSPTITQRTAVDAEISVPSAGAASNYTFLWPPFRKVKGPKHFADCENVQEDFGFFSNCPLKYNTADLLNEISFATSPDGNDRNHSRWDGTKFQYIGRSYGAGASVGIKDAHIMSLGNIESYRYSEVGLSAELQCIYNRSAATDLLLQTTNISRAYPNLYMATGALPNANWTKIAESDGKLEDPFIEKGVKADIMRIEIKDGYDLYAQNAFDQSDIVSTWVQSDDRTHYFGLSAGANYLALDKIQCEIKYRPTTFNITVSTSNYTIKVVPNVDQLSVENPDPERRLSKRVTAAIYPSYILTTLYVSVVGEAFLNNIQNAKVRNNIPVSANATNDTVLEAVTDSVTAMIDGTLVSLLSYGLVSNVTTSTPVEMTLAAARIGSGGFILAVVLLNILGLVAVLIMGFWIVRSDVPMFDYNHIGELAIAVREGTAQGLMQDKIDGTLDVQTWVARLHVSDGQQRPAVILKRAGGTVAGPIMRNENKGRGFFTKGRGYVYEELTT